MTGGRASGGLLEVAVTQQRDVPGCVEGGADRLSLRVPGRGHGLSPEPAAASAVIRSSEVPVRVVLRAAAGDRADETTLGRLAELGAEYLALGAEGVELGFLDADLEIDAAACRALLSALPGVAWTLHRAIDDTLDPLRSWGRVVDLPGLTSVRSGGSPRGLGQGYDDLLALAEGSAEVARLLMPAGDLTPEHVPWLVRAGVRQLHVDTQARPGGTHHTYVDAGYVRSWRRLLDDAVERAESRR